MNAARRRLTVVVQERMFIDDPFDGFVQRQKVIMSWLYESYDVAIIAMRDRRAAPMTMRPEVEARTTCRVLYEPVAPTRRKRIGLVIDSLRKVVSLTDWEHGLRAAVEATVPDSVLAVGPWIHLEFRSLFPLNTVLLAEEDLTQMHEIAPQSFRARLLRCVEDLARRRVPNPSAVLVIAPTEKSRAAAKYPGAHISWLPFVLDDQEWPRASTASSGDDVLVMGVFCQARNAEGLAEVLAALAASHPGVRVRIASDAGLHACLLPFIGVNAQVVSGDDPYSLYRSAACALVPSRRSTGVKTTILQAWRAGCPVACFASSVPPLGNIPSGAVLSASTPRGVAARVWELVQDRQQQLAVAGKGFEANDAFYTRVVAEPIIRAVLDSARVADF